MSEQTLKLGIEPRYSLTEAAMLIGVPKATLRSWLVGQRNSEPVLRADADPSVGVSFFNLIEAKFLAFYRRRSGVSMQRVRTALDYVAGEKGIQRPLLDEEFETDGRDLFCQIDEQLLDASGSPGQRVWRDAIKEYFRSIDFDSHGPKQFWILGRHRECVIDPRVQFGEPILPRTGTSIELVHSRFEAGETIPEIACDLALDQLEVEEAIRCERALRRAA